MKKMKVVIGSDHAGYELKEFLKKNLSEIQWIDVGTKSKDRTDYPDYAFDASKKILDNKANIAVLVCGSGIGMAISANKIPGIRAAVVESEATARLAKQHNNANVLCIGSRILAPEYAKEIVQAWLSSSFEAGRHRDRLDKISKLEKTFHATSKPSKK